MTSKSLARERSLSFGSDDAGANGVARHEESKGAASSGAARRQENGGTSVGGSRPRPLDAPDITLWQRYLLANKTNPLRTKCLTTGVLMAAGNLGAQCILKSKGKQKGIIYKKLVAFIIFGVFLSGPLGHMWLKFLNGHKTSLKGQSLILYKIALDRLAYGPAFNLLMMSFVYKLSGQNWKQVLASLQKTFWSAQVLNWKMWPVAQYVNFNFIPPELQLLYMNVVALFWTIGLSMIMN
mmetsp:Transcript_92969/g.135876  ORF Transcript_92969/g.135876 Transcript_92969/m.135876 type:complete len:238 (+) Transcript_92969:89-802(+)|eukprot:CAMPEP_0179430792 /NCGR_PEP_ID=MMETSP0799-20121207/15832_1 /TAXON_ID=46947 /ORGANISM="Geminigera cryophila, Strain CCMP2564" /LENGTH=237 /DNA_ID=CAMNT_0021207377 /DNA_START=196 /DNA_END=909 /DNA_ORIENTATION=-